MKKKIILALTFTLSLAGLKAQYWQPVSEKIEPIRKEIKILYAYKIDLNALRGILRNAPEVGKDAVPVVVSIPTTDGKIEKFSVYSSLVMEKSMADRYQLGSYSGVGLDSPNKQIRFSTSPNDFQSMIIDSNTGKSEFIEPVTKEKDIYAVFFKTDKPQDGRTFECTTVSPKILQNKGNQLLQSEKRSKKRKRFLR